ncbi:MULTISPECIES: hypothetical protein [unclassified Streptomyces]|uniref:hypothetical protein n=1 Tax=unclassified Streptomyces TaxID=2593676 RepID=UPI002DD9BCC7|nr:MULTISPECIES: hypothetical protein [unclassified Streptomyces]WSA97687.1 hypothetical protein OIE63_39985 [Streptomyces sp. NBC_01795]WSB82062.1 hypothetical protein OHB04_40825 [Streptomyces sp. NBC_01775]WSS46795.1 hypothetical protein OG220_40230 [Streptomyces sp. NBC_01187]WSS46988.1 hypothetical protein OG220_41395 [Streptomyces sp. NBC_01187]
MSQLLETLNFLAAEKPKPIIPEFSPEVPTTLRGPTGKILSWTAGGGLAMAVLGGLSGWACVAIGHNSERGGLAARGKQAVVWSLISGVGVGVTSGLVMAFYNMSKGG